MIFNNTHIKQGGEIVLMIALTILLLTGTAGAVPAEEWNRTYMGGAVSVLQASDGGYIVLGSISQPYLFSWDKIPGNDNVLLLEYLKQRFNVGWTETATIEKIDDGKTIRVDTGTGTHFFSLRLNDEKTNVKLEFDNERQFEFIVNSENGELKIYSNYDINSDAELVKTDAKGNLQWKKRYGGISSDDPSDFQRTSDGGYIIAGSTTSYGVGLGDAWIIKTDINGKELWNRTFGGKDDDYAYSIQQIPDGGYIIGGQTYSFGGTWLIKTDANGKELWNRTYGGRAFFFSDLVTLTADRGYILYGGTVSPGGGDAWVIKTNSKGDEQWNITLGSGMIEFYSVQQTSDNGIIIAGYKDPKVEGGYYDALLIKLDVNGNLQWNKTYGGTFSDLARSVQQTSDSGYIFAGMTYSYGTGDSDAWLVKTDANGNEQWNRTFGDVNNEEFRSIHITSDGGYILAGWTMSYSTPTSATNFWVVKVGPKEEVIIPTVVSTPVIAESPEKSNVEFVPYLEEWNKTFGGVDYDAASSVEQTPDGGYILAGQTISSGNDIKDAWLIKTDPNGNELWNRTFERERYGPVSFQQTKDGGYILAGSALLIKTDANGNKQWSKTFGLNDLDYAYSVQQTSDSGFIIVGKTYSNSDGSDDALLIKTDINGDRQWSKTYGGAGGDEPSFGQQTKDGGYIIVGLTRGDAWLVKTDVNGNELWNRTYGDAEHGDVGSYVQQSTDGGYMLVGDFNDQITLLKLDANGYKLWNKTIAETEPKPGRAYSLMQTSDGGYIIVGSSVNSWLIKTDADGNTQWNMTLGSLNEAKSVRGTKDGGYILAGKSYLSGGGNIDAWLIKLKAKQESVDNITGIPTTTQPKETVGFEALFGLAIVLIVSRIKTKAT